jgi:nitrile hydratase subunit beta
MNGGHDLGGMHGLGPIEPEAEAEEPVFHHAWEKRVFALTLATSALGRWTIDMGRHARERQHPADYLRHSYYENWLAGLEKLVVERGLVSAEELASGKASGPADEAVRARVLRAANVGPIMAKGGPVDIAIDAPPRFAVGDRVRAVNRHPTGHTRQPRYVRGRTGVVHEHYGAHVFPDRSAAGERVGRHLYSVRFEAGQLWGESAVPAGAVYLDLWEDYLEPAG